jgi:hypothetical protein
MLDDSQANFNDVMGIHWVACSTGVGSTDEEARCKGLGTFGGMPGGSHSLPIFLRIFSCGTLVLCDEPAKLVEKDSAWVFRADLSICFTNSFW